MVTLRYNTIYDFRMDAGSRFETPCFVYLGGMNGSAYGQLPKPLHGTRLAHIAVWRENFRPLVPELQIDHRCRVRICIRVEHLEAVTPAENIRRRVWMRASRKSQAVHTGRRYLPVRTARRDPTGHLSSSMHLLLLRGLGPQQGSRAVAVPGSPERRLGCLPSPGHQLPASARGRVRSACRLTALRTLLERTSFHGNGAGL